MLEWTPVDSIDYNPQALACGVGLYLGYLPYFPLWVGPPPAAAVCPGRVIPALGATGLVPYTPLSLNFSLHIRGLGHTTLEPPDLHALIGREEARASPARNVARYVELQKSALAH